MSENHTDASATPARGDQPATDGGRVSDGGRTDGGFVTHAAADDGEDDAIGRVARDSEWGPTGLSTAIVVVVTLGLAAVLAARLGQAPAALVAVIDAVCFGVTLWLAGRERWRVVALAVAGVFSLFVGGGFVLAIGYGTLTLVSDLYPVSRTGLVAPTGLQVVSTTLAIVGATLAMIGGVTAVGNVLREETVEAYTELSARTLLVPGGLSVVLFVSALLSQYGQRDGTGPIGAGLSIAADGVGAFLSPAPGETHTLTFTVLVAGATLLIARAIRTLPIAELTDDGHAGPSERASAARVAESVADGLRKVGLAALVFLPIAGAETLAPEETVTDLLGAWLYGLLVGLTSGPLVRWLLVRLAALALVVVLVVRGLQRTARTSPDSALLALVPYVGGVGIVGLVIVGHGPVLAGAIAFVTRNLPGVFAEVFERQTGAIVEFYGPLTVALVLATGLVLLSATLALALQFVMQAGFLPREVAAPAVASTGLFVAAAFAGAAGVTPPLVIAGIVASLLVWDVGEFGVTMGREIGRTAITRGAEAVHLTATLAVGAIGALATVALSETAMEATISELTTLPFAIVAAVVGLVFLFAALR